MTWLAALAVLAGSEATGPVIHPDRSVTFSLSAPEAAQATLRLDEQPLTKMHKDASGIWRVTVPPLPTGVYTYSFYLGRSQRGDPANPKRKPIHTGGYESVLLIRGSDSEPWANAQRKGQLQRVTLDSKVMGEKREFLVYIPHGISDQGSKRYPVLYLLHGVTENPDAWITAGRVDEILENLIAQKRSTPKILVMPLGYGMSDSTRQMNKAFSPSPAVQQRLFRTFSEHLTREILPEVERRYQVQTTSRGRSVAGVSMGGAQAVYLGLTESTQFARATSLGGAMMIFGTKLDDWFPGLSGSRTAELRLWCGSSDFVLPSNKFFTSWLTSRSIPFAFEERAGGHTWHRWTQDLAALLEDPGS